MMEGTEKARLRQRFPSLSTAGTIFPLKAYLYSQRVNITYSQGVRSQDTVSSLENCNNRTRSEV